MARTYPGWEVDPETAVCVTCGSTEAMIATMLALVDPGEEVIVFTPFYENYGPDAILSGATPRYVELHSPTGASTRPSCGPRSTTGPARSSSTPRTTRPARSSAATELELIAELCQRHDVLCFTDEIYEHIHYLGPGGHIPPATVPGSRTAPSPSTRCPRRTP